MRRSASKGRAVRPHLARRIAYALIVILVLTVVGLTGGPAVVETGRLPFWRADGRLLPDRMAIGVTHTQHSADSWNPRPAVNRAVDVLKRTVDVQNQAIMGWGVSNPQPYPRVYDWASLDARVEFMRRTPGSVLSLTLCGAPDWMKGGRPGETDWNALEKAPAADHYDDFADLAATVARRYPDVEYFFVWNELKGFYDPAVNEWDVAGYTAMYNQVYRAIKAVRPWAKVGGPYVPMDSWSSRAVMSHPSELSGSWGVVDGRSLSAVRYWLRNNAGADFIAIDGSSSTRDRGVITDEHQATDKFADITRWIRQQTDLPIWWSELYPDPADRELPADSPLRAQLYLSALVKLHAAGCRGVLLWQPESRPDAGTAALWSSTASPSGGAPLPLAEPLRWLRNQLDAGARPTLRYDGQTLVLSSRGASLTVNG